MADLGPILAVDVVVADLELATTAYVHLLGHEQLASGTKDGRSWRLLGPAGARWGLIRLLESRGAPAPPVFRTLGWSALEILVADAGAACERCLATEGFEVLQRPIPVGGAGLLRALQARGPGGEGVYLTQVLGPSDRFQLPSLEDAENRVYAVVAGTHRLEGVREALEAEFGAVPVTDHALPIRVLNQAYGLPPDTLHRLSTVQLKGSALIEIDEYPPGAVRRPAGSAGIRSVTFCGGRPSSLEVEAGLRLVVAAPPTREA